MDDDILWLLAGLILCGVVGGVIFRLLRRRALDRAEAAQVAARIAAAEREQAEREAEAISLREAADRRRAAERAAEAEQQRREDELRAQAARDLAAAEAEAQRLAVEARARIDAARAAADVAARLAEAAARRIETDRLAAATAARAAADRAERERIDQERLARERAEQERAEAARREQLRAAEALAEAVKLQEQAERERAEQHRAEQERAAARVTEPEDTLVLIADDSKIVRVKTGRLLTAHRYRVAYAVDGADAERQIRADRPHVLITDVEMPELDGFELTRRLRADPDTAGLPVIMITAADDKHRAHAEQAGVDVLLGKPYAEDELVDHVRRVMHLDAFQRRAAA